MTDQQIQAKATIAAALILSRSVDPEALASLNKNISNQKLVHLRELTERIYFALAEEQAGSSELSVFCATARSPSESCQSGSWQARSAPDHPRNRGSMKRSDRQDRLA
jgi:hypothetical protein